MAPPVTFDKACFVTKLGSVTKNERDKCIRSVQSPKRPEVSPHQLKQIQKKICRFQFRSATNSEEKTRCTGHKHSHSHSENLQIVMTWSQTTQR